MPFTNCWSRINNTQVDDVHDIDVVTSMWNLIEYTYNYSKTSGILWQYCREEPALNDGAIVDFTAKNATTDSFIIKEKIAGNNDTKNVKTMVPLKYLSNF